MNHSFHSADRTTHLKIVGIALVVSAALAAFGLSAGPTTTEMVQAVRVIKVGQPTMMSSSGTSSLVR